MSNREETPDFRVQRRARRLGAILQGLVLGLLVALSIVELVAQADGVRLFRYQTF